MSDQYTNSENDTVNEEMSTDNYRVVLCGANAYETDNYRVVLCGANAYEKKYYFNNKFDKIPENIKEELHIICVLFTEEVGGVFTIGFTPYGELEMDTQMEEGDLLYDEIGAELLKKEIRRKKADMFRALSIYFKVTFLHQDAAALLEEDEEEDE